MVRPRHCRADLLICAVTIAAGVLVGACSGTPEDANAANAGGPAAARAGGAAGARAGVGAGGRRRSVIVAPTDVAVVTSEPISDAIPVTGTLQPLTSVDVRARIDGDLTGVFVREGERVGQGQLLARFEAVAEQSSAASAQAGSAAAKADLSQAEWNLKQTTDLYRAGAVSEGEYRTAQQQVNASNARLAAAAATQSSASLSARDTRVTAPISGIISKRMVDVGEHLARGAPMFTLVRNSTLELQATVPERSASAVKVGQRVTFSVDGQELTGAVARMSPTIDPASRSITVYVDVPNADGAIKGNSLATGSILLRTVNGALVVPTGALHQGLNNGSTYVYRINTGAVEQVNVNVGIVNNGVGKAQITSGLVTGDRIISGNLGTLSAGATVQVIGGDAARRGPR